MPTGTRERFLGKKLFAIIFILLFSSAFFLDISISPLCPAGLLPAFAEDNVFTDNVGIGTAAPAALTHLSSTAANDLFKIEDNGAGDGSPLVVDENGNLGIGTASTGTYKLWVNGNTYLGGLAVTNGAFTFGGDLEMNGYAIESSTGGLTFDPDDDGTNEVVMDTNGNVGIGTTAPTSKLHIVGDSGTYTDLTLQYTTNTKWGVRADTNGDFGIRDLDNSEWAFFAQDNGSTSLYANGIEGLKIQSDGDIEIMNGNVGIGTTGPGYPLEVEKTGVVFNGGTAYREMRVADNTAAVRGVFLGYDSSGQHGIIGADTGSAASDLQFWTYSGSAWGERVRVDGSGNVGIGTTGPGYKLEVSGTENTNLIAVTGGASTLVLRPATSAAQAIGGIGAHDLIIMTGNTGRMYFQNSSGNIAAGSSATAAGSKFGVNGNTAIGSSYYTQAAPTNGVIIEGNVGIGSTVPGSKLDVNGAINIAGAGNISMTIGNNQFIKFANTGGTQGIVYGVSVDNNTYVTSFVGQDIILTPDAGATTGLRVQATSGNVGIGSTGPLAKLDVAGAISATGTITGAGITPGGNITMGDDAWIGLGASAGRIVFDDAGTDGVNIMNGNVGIGTTGPGAKLWVTQDMTMGNDVTDGTYQMAITGATDSNKRMILGYDTNGNGFGFIKAGNRTVAWTPLALQPSGGNVGIGTTAPEGSLVIQKNADGVVGGQIFISNRAASAPGNSAELIFKVNANFNEPYHSASIKAIEESSLSNTSLQLSTYLGAGGAVDVMRLTSAGNVGIGTTGPACGLDVGGGSATLVGGAGDVLVKDDLEVDDDVRIDGGAITLSAATTVDLADSSSTSLNIESGLLTLDTQNSRVGIGTTGPGTKLDVNGSIRLPYDLQVSDGGGLQVLNGASAQTVKMGALWVSDSYTGTPPVNGAYIKGNVGIGTTGPTGKLTITNGIIGAGSISTAILLDASYGSVTSAQSIDWQYTGQTNRPLRIAGTFNADGTGMDLGFYTSTSYTANGTEKVRINKDGNVGIGTTDPSKLLTLKTSTDTSGTYFLQTIGGATHLSGRAYGIAFDPEGYGNRNKIAIVAEGDDGGYSHGNLHILMDSTEDSSEATLSDAKVTFLNTGNVGIGTTAPAYKFEVWEVTTLGTHANQGAFIDTTALAANVGGMITFGGNYTGTTKTTWSGIQGAKENATDGNFAGDLRFYARANNQNFSTGERMRITSAGNVGIGTTAPGGKLQVVTTSDTSSTITTWDSRFFVVGASGDTGALSLSYNQTSNTGLIQALSPNVAWRNIAIAPNGGNVGIGTTAPGSKLEVYNGDIFVNTGMIYVDGASGSRGRLALAGKSNTFTYDSDTLESYGVSAYADSVLGNPGLALAGYNFINFFTNSQSKMVITNAGNVGIGTTGPLAKLTAMTASDGAIVNLLRLENRVNAGNNLGSAIVFGSGELTGNQHIAKIVGKHTTAGYTELGFFTSPDGTTENAVERVTIQHDGNVGIGTTAPTNKLHVVGTCYATKFTDGGSGYDFFMPNPACPDEEMLRHWAIETDGLKTIYSGNAQTDDTAECIVQMPSWFAPLNDISTCTYSLTSLSGLGQVAVKEKMSASGAFVVVSEYPRQEFSWTVIVYRGDPIGARTMRENPIVEKRR